MDKKTSKVYYNSACPVCRTGVEAQSRCMAATGIEGVEWIDIHRHPEAVCELGASLEDVRERLHVKTVKGEVKVGADAVAELWADTPGWRWLAGIAAVPLLHGFSQAAYNRFARCLYRWNIRKNHWQPHR